MRVYMAWFMKRERSFDERSLPVGCRVSTTPHNRFVFFEREDVELEEIKPLFSLFQQLGLHCRTINLFLPGNVPNLCLYGFEAQNGNVFSYPHDDISISAVPYGPHEWCYMMRNERSIPFRAIHTLPYFQETALQISLFDKEIRGEKYA